MPATGEEGASFATLATRSLHIANATDHYSDVRIQNTKPATSISVSFHRQDYANHVTAASTQLGAKIAGDGENDLHDCS